MISKPFCLFSKYCYKFYIQNILTLSLLLPILFYVPLARAQDLNDSVLQKPETIYNSVDKNGVSLATGEIKVIGPYVSIGGQGRSKLTVSPNSIVTHNDITARASCAQNCYELGFFEMSSSIAPSLYIGGFPAEQESASNVLATVSAGKTTAKFYSSDNTPQGFKEYQPSVGRTLSYASGYASAYPGDKGERLVFQEDNGDKYTFLFQSTYCPNPTIGQTALAYPVKTYTH